MRLRPAEPRFIYIINKNSLSYKNSLTQFNLY